MDRIYLDHAATTPVATEVVAAMLGGTPHTMGIERVTEVLPAIVKKLRAISPLYRRRAYVMGDQLKLYSDKVMDHFLARRHR